MQKIRIPLRFRMTEQNAIRPELAPAWKKALREKDLLVQVRVCSSLNDEDSSDLLNKEDPLCPRVPDAMQAKGVAKLLRLENSILRGPVSLPL